MVSEPLSVQAIPALRDNYIWLLQANGHAAVVDPGEPAPVLAALARAGLELAAILVTHHHGDHVGGIAALTAARPLPVYAPQAEAIAGCTHPVADGQHIVLPGLAIGFEVIAVPGHTRGHVAYYRPGHLFCGDTLFGCGCGRLFEGTPAQMQTSLARLAALPAHTLVHCAHEYTLANIAFAQAVEPDNAEIAARRAQCERLRAAGLPTLPSTIGEECATNPFLRWAVPAVVAAASAHAGAAPADPVAVFAAIRAWKDVF